MGTEGELIEFIESEDSSDRRSHRAWRLLRAWTARRGSNDSPVGRQAHRRRERGTAPARPQTPS